MIKQLTTWLDYSIFAELALIMFALIFIAVVVRTLLTRSDVIERQSRIVLGESETNSDSNKLIRENHKDSQPEMKGRTARYE